MSTPFLSIVVPVFNEEATLEKLLETVLENCPADGEIIVVNDGSKDGTARILESFSQKVQVIHQSSNMGKGAAIRRGFSCCKGEFVLVQDADLEYDPADYPKLLAPARSGDFDVIYGSRFKNRGSAKSRYRSFYLGNHLLTWVTNVFTGLKLSDMETCYKLVRRELLQKINLTESGFGIEPEITCRLARIPGVRFLEVPISYHGRTIEEGKKIKWRDGVWALWQIMKYSLF